MGVGDTDYGGFLDAGMGKEGVFHLLGGDHLAAAFDEVLGAAGKIEVAVLVEIAAVASEEPIIVKGAAGGLLVGPIAGHEAGAAGGDFALLSLREGRAVFVQDGDFNVVQGPADGGQTTEPFFDLLRVALQHVVFRG